RSRIRDVVVLKLCLSREDVPRRIKTRPRRPQELIRRTCIFDAVVQNDHLPALELSARRDEFCKVGLRLIAFGFEDKTAATKRLGRAYSRRQFAAKFPGKIAFLFAKAQKDRLTPVVDLSACVIKRVERRLRENVQIGSPIDALKNVLKERFKVAQVLRRVGQEEELCERQLPFAKDSKSGR